MAASVRAARTDLRSIGDLVVQGVEQKKRSPQIHHHVGGRRHLHCLGQEQLVTANVLGTELIGWFAGDGNGKRPNGVQVQPDRWSENITGSGGLPRIADVVVRVTA